MRAVIQRVDKAGVQIEQAEQRNIGVGLLILIGIEEADSQEDVLWLSKKIVNLRIFDDEEGVMNKSLLDVGGELMVVSQFTLHAKTMKGNRPSYVHAARPEIAIPLYQSFIDELGKLTQKQIVTGEFGAHMHISLINNGPVTILMDTKNKE